MKTNLLKTVTLLLCISAMILGSVLTVQAEDMKEVITEEHHITIRPQQKNNAYVYVNAEVPKSWGGEIQVSFHSRTTGKDYICSMSYIENEYHSGLWLPAGSYQVSAELPQDDGLCRLELKDSSQSDLNIKSGEDLYLTVLALENDDTQTPSASFDSSIVPPKSQEEYNDLPTAADDTTTNPTETIEETTDGPQEDSDSMNEVIKVLSIILVVVVVILAIIYAIWERLKNGNDE